MAALDLDELSGGRFALGLGSGVRRLNEDWHDVEWERPVRRMRETVEIIRRLVAAAHLDEPIEVAGETTSMQLRGYKRAFEAVRTSIPVYLATIGPQMTRLAGELASPDHSRGWRVGP